jgi:hypothetical protein
VNHDITVQPDVMCPAKMASQVQSLCPLLIENNKFCQSIYVTNEELLCEYGDELLSGSLKGMEFEGLQRDLN